jgi:hypothetical protein
LGKKKFFISHDWVLVAFLDGYELWQDLQSKKVWTEILPEEAKTVSAGEACFDRAFNGSWKGNLPGFLLPSVDDAQSAQKHGLAKVFEKTSTIYTTHEWAWYLYNYTFDEATGELHDSWDKYKVRCVYSPEITTLENIEPLASSGLTCVAKNKKRSADISFDSTTKSWTITYSDGLKETSLDQMVYEPNVNTFSKSDVESLPKWRLDFYSQKQLRFYVHVPVLNFTGAMSGVEFARKDVDYVCKAK